LIAQSGDTSGPFSFDRRPSFELEADLAKEINRRCEIVDDDSYVVHPFQPHVSNLQDVVCSDNGAPTFFRVISLRDGDLEIAVDPRDRLLVGFAEDRHHLPQRPRAINIGAWILTF
jgi:hypothetical protein